MAINNMESKGWGTLLQVTKQAPKALVSSLKELIEPSFKPLNHLITTGPKLDGNTLHIKVLFQEWTVILWLKWLTCSIRFVLPLYMVNVGWVNRRGSFPFFNSTYKRWFRDLVESPTYSIIAQTFVRWALDPPFVMTIFIARKRLTGRSPRLRPVATIPIIIIRGARIWRSPSLSLVV